MSKVFKASRTDSIGSDLTDDEDVESLMSSSEDEVKPRQTEFEGEASSSCAIRRLLESERRGVLLYRVARCMIDLDDVTYSLAGKGVWSNILAVLKQTVNSRDPHEISKRRAHWKSLRDLSDAMEQSIDRLLARLDTFFASRQAKELFTRLIGPEKKSFNACLQVWRKHFRDHRCSYVGRLECRLTTCLQVSKLLDRQSSTLTFCNAFGCSNEINLSDHIDTQAFEGWSTLSLCCPSAQRFREALDLLLPRMHSGIRIVAERHGHREEPQGLVLPPIAYLSEARLPNVFRNPPSIDQLDSNSVYRLIVESQSLIKRFTFAPPSLTATSAWILKSSTESTERELLVGHLADLVRHVYRCTSCKKAVSAPASLLVDISSGQTSTAAFRAGFDVRPQREATFARAMRQGSYWVPAFREAMLPMKEIETRDPFRRHNPQLLNAASKANSAVPSSFFFGALESSCMQERQQVDVDDAWRFCLPCCSAHLGVPGVFEDVICRCQVCNYERTTDPLLKPDDNVKIRFNSIWSRDKRLAATVKGKR